MALVRRLVRDRRAQDLAEYGIALAAIGGLATAVSVAIAGNVNTLWNAANTIISGATGS
jgi:Flp pilus assembly pilin Flp